MHNNLKKKKKTFVVLENFRINMFDKIVDPIALGLPSYQHKKIMSFIIL